MKYRFLVIALVLILASVLGACGSKATPAPTDTPAPTATTEPSPAASPAAPAEIGGLDVAMSNIVQPEGEVVAIVNGVEIPSDLYLGELERQLRYITEQYGVDWNDTSNDVVLTQVQSDTYQQLINLELIRQAATADKVTVSAEALQAEVDLAKEEILAGGGYADWEDFLAVNQITEEYFLDRIRDSLLIDEMVALHGGDTEAEQAHAQHILVSDEETANKVLDELEAGATFEELAKKYSSDTASRDMGGDLGWFPRGMMVQPFEDAVFSMEVGTVSEPVQTDFGYHIIKLLAKETRPLEGSILEQSQQQAFSEWFFAYRDGADIQRLLALGE